MQMGTARVLKRMIDTVEEQLGEQAYPIRNQHLLQAVKAAKLLRREIGEYIYDLQDGKETA